MANSQVKFAVDEYVTREQQVEVLSHRSGQRILDGNDGCLYRTALYPVEDLGRSRARHNRRARQHLACRLMTERAEFSLDRNFHGDAPSISELELSLLGLPVTN